MHNGPTAIAEYAMSGSPAGLGLLRGMPHRKYACMLSNQVATAHLPEMAGVHVALQVARITMLRLTQSARRTKSIHGSKASRVRT